jgi:type IX secretion system PorP/SprF family membrane protein
MTSIKNLSIIRYSILLAVLLVIAGTRQASAQLTGLQAMYFQNQYLANPAMAGLDTGLSLNMGYQRQWASIPGGPKLQDFTGDYGSGNKVGLGFMINSDESGLIYQTRIMGTYAYHLPVSDKGKLNFGLSFGVNDSYIDYSKILGNQADVAVQQFNQRRVYLDGDLGIAYTSNGLNVQAAVPNLGSLIFNTQAVNLSVDRSTFYTAASYRVPLSANSTAFTLEPKVAFRGIKGFQNIMDAGANLVMAEYNLSVSGIYHTNQSATVGIGFDLKPVGVLLSYTNNTGPLKSYANNTFEFGVKYALFTGKKNDGWWDSK